MAQEQLTVNFNDFEKDVNDMIVKYREESLKNISERVAQTVKQAQQKERGAGMVAKFSSKMFENLMVEVAEKFNGKEVTPEQVAEVSTVTKDVKIIAHRIKWMTLNKRYENIVKITNNGMGAYKIEKVK